MFHVKICGVMTDSDARLVVAAGADAIGLNFVAGSPRCLDIAAARTVRAAVPPGVLTVGVFAGMPPDEIRRVANAVALDAIQLHGHLDPDHPAGDPPERCRDLAPLRILRALRLESPGEADPLAAGRQWIEEARRLGHAPSMAIIDATVSRGTEPGQLGGTGARVDWQALARARPLDIPTALAGGLNAANVAEAIRATGVTAVDTASGVEAAPGRKDPVRVRAFVEAALRALGHG